MFSSFLPESPRWLITKKQYDRAYRYLFKADSPHIVKEDILTEISLPGDITKVLSKINYIFLNVLYLLILIHNLMCCYGFIVLMCKQKKLPTESLWQKLKKGPLQQLAELFATSKLRRLISISYFMFCTTSLCYYVTGIVIRIRTSTTQIYIRLFS